MKEKNYRLGAELRHELHRHPELSCEEIWTKNRLAEFLRAHTKSLEIVDRGRWLYAHYRGNGQGKKIALRADFDALPIEETIELPYGSECSGVSHKCGHDGHAATLAAFALELEERGTDNDVYLVFQHAEEIGAGAVECAVLMDEEQIDEVYAYHNAPGIPQGSILVGDGNYSCASMGMSLYFEGKTSHASAPGVGRNPAPAISRIVLALPQLYRPEDYTGLVLATVIQIDLGETAFGTSAGSGVLRLTIRGQHEKEMYTLRDRINTMANALCAEYGLSFRVEYCDVFPENVNERGCTEKVRAAARRLGLQLLEREFPEAGSEDFGYFTKRVPGSYFDVGAGEDVTPLHTVTYDFPDEIIPTAAAVFAELTELK